MPGVPAAATTAAAAASFPRIWPLHSGWTATAPSFPANFFQMLAPSAWSTPELSSSFSLLSSFPPLSDLPLLSSTILLPPSPYCPSFAHPVPFHRTRSASFALVPFPSSFQLPLSASSCSSYSKNGVEGRAARRDGKDESNKEGDILERADKRREVSVSPLRDTRVDFRWWEFFSTRKRRTPAPLVSIFSFAFPFAALQSTTLLLSRKGEKMQQTEKRGARGR